MQKRVDEVMTLYEAMRSSGMKPNAITEEVVRSCFAFGSVHFYSKLLPDLKLGPLNVLRCI